MVRDATADSELADICFETTLAGLERQFKGGLTIGENSTIFTERARTEAEAAARLSRSGP